jgi:uncharacterized protein (TIGR03437 family)
MTKPGSGFTKISWRGAALFVSLLTFVVSAPDLEAQQYCVSGAVTSTQNCTACTINVGDAVAMTFTVNPSSVNCSSPAAGTESCTGNTGLSARIGARYWTSAGSQNPYIGQLQISTGEAPDQSTITNFSITGSGSLSPFTNPSDPVLSLAGVFVSSAPGNLVPNGVLPTALPTPAATSATGLRFNLMTGDGSALMSYTGQTCASAGSSPVVNVGGIVPVYSASSTIQPGSWVSIFGNNLAPAAATWNGDFPVSLGGTSVTINGKPAYLWYVSPTQINLQAPDDTASGSVAVVVTTSSGTVTSSVTLGQFGPSFSVLDGKHVAGIILRSDGSGGYGGGTYDIVGPTGTSLGYKTVAAKAGDVLELFGVGFGPTSPAVPAGKVYSGAAPTIGSVSLSINNIQVTPGFSGLTSAGLYQINLTLPAGLGSGDVPLQAIAGGSQTPSGVVLSVQ